MSLTIPRPEYPRPDFERSEWINLNGEWEFEFDDKDTGEMEQWYTKEHLSRNITVPFCWQSELSGIHDLDLHEIMWYRKSFALPEDFAGKRVFLNFGAVDYEAKIWINSIFAGSHKGGYIPFKIDISPYLKDKDNIIAVRVEDRYDTVQPRGKQYWKQKPDRCWYTAVSGIWQTVWLECAGELAIERIRITPDIDRRCASAEIYLEKQPVNARMKVRLSFSGQTVQSFEFDVNQRISEFNMSITGIDYIDEWHYWTPEAPNLYDVEFCLLEGEKVLDSVKTYFGMRKISVKGDTVLLNNRPLYQKLILDQGYWPESLITPPSDEAIKLDIEMTKKLGFNGSRKHQKIEDPRYYYWADKLGLLVWAEMPSAYNFNMEEAENIFEEWSEFIKRDYNHPCIITWVPLNESWGVKNILTDKKQMDFARALYYLTHTLDGTRLVSSNDGWEQVVSDICAIHDYTAEGEELTTKLADLPRLLEGSAVGRMIYADGERYRGQPVLVTEYGGIAFVSADGEQWGYGYGVKSENEFFRRYEGLTEALKNTSSIKGYCYTQLTDVMQEVNGLLTAGRKPKVSMEKIKAINTL